MSVPDDVVVVVVAEPEVEVVVGSTMDCTFSELYVVS